MTRPSFNSCGSPNSFNAGDLFTDVPNIAVDPDSIAICHAPKPSSAGSAQAQHAGLCTGLPAILRQHDEPIGHLMSTITLKPDRLLPVTH